MRKYLTILCFIISGLFVLLAVAKAVYDLFLNNHQYSSDTAYNMGYITGCILFPVILIVIAIFLIRVGKQLALPEEDQDTETTNSPSP